MADDIRRPRRARVHGGGDDRDPGSDEHHYGDDEQAGHDGDDPRNPGSDGQGFMVRLLGSARGPRCRATTASMASWWLCSLDGDGGTRTSVIRVSR